MSQIQIQKNKNTQIKELLQKVLNENEISFWKMNSYKKRKNNIYIQKDYKIESVLESQRNEFDISVAKDYEDCVGESSFKISQSADIEDFRKELLDAIFICSKSKSRKYDYIKKEDKEVDDSEIDYDSYYSQKFVDDFETKNLNLFFAEKLEIFKELIDRNWDDELQIKLNALEFHNNIVDENLETSNRVVKSNTKTNTYIEFVLTAVHKVTKNETEHIIYKKINDVYRFDFEEFFKENISFAVHSAKDNRAKDFSGKVILTKKAVMDFFNPDLSMNSVIAQCLARYKYHGVTRFEKGDEVIKGKYDRLTIYSNPLRVDNNRSHPYDDEGLCARKLCLIRDNVLENFAASNKYGQYINEKPTGPLGPFEIETGNKSYNELIKDKDKQIEIVTFASFSPDTISGDFSAEIRLGYIIENGKRKPFKGGLFTGNVFRLLEVVELSKESIDEVGYIGPKSIKFHNGSVVGL